MSYFAKGLGKWNHYLYYRHTLNKSNRTSQCRITTQHGLVKMFAQLVPRLGTGWWEPLAPGSSQKVRSCVLAQPSLQPPCPASTRLSTAELIHACAAQSFILQLNRVCKLCSPYAACNVWRAVFPSSKLKFPGIAQLFSGSHLTAVFRLPSHSHCSIAFEGMKIFSGKYFVGLFFFSSSLLFCFDTLSFQNLE